MIDSDDSVECTNANGYTVHDRSDATRDLLDPIQPVLFKPSNSDSIV